MPNDTELSRRDFLKAGVSGTAGLAAISSISFYPGPKGCSAQMTG